RAARWPLLPGVRRDAAGLRRVAAGVPPRAGPHHRRRLLLPGPLQRLLPDVTLEMPQGPDLPVLVVDGSRFDDPAGLSREVPRLLAGCPRRGHPAALHAVPARGYGTPRGGFVLRWLHSERSRAALAHAETARRLERLLPSVDPSGRAAFVARLDAARRGE